MTREEELLSEIEDLREQVKHWVEQYDLCEEDYEHIFLLMERRLEQVIAERDALRAQVEQLKGRSGSSF